MGIRITGGRLAGRQLPGTVGPGVRPTSARVREAWFSIVGQHLDGLTLLDAFAGSGVMALEAWSRGAQVVAVERDARTYRALVERVGALGAQVKVVRGDLDRVVARLGRFDIVFADPPYADVPERWLRCLAPSVAAQLWIETSRRAAVPDLVAGLRRSHSRTFGDTALHRFEPQAPQGEG